MQNTANQKYIKTSLFEMKSVSGSNLGRVRDLQCKSYIPRYIFNRYLLRFFDCLAHPNLSATFDTDQK